MRDSQSILIASILSLLFLFGWEHFVAKPQRLDNQQDDTPKGIELTTGVAAEQEVVSQADEVFNEGPKLFIEGDAVEGSMDLKGLKLDRLVLKKYKRELDENENVELFIPKADGSAYYAEFGFLSTDSALILPNHNTIWKANKQTLKTGQSVQLTWKSPQNVVFEVELSLDDEYMFHVKHFVTNNSNLNITYNNYGLITRTHNEMSRNNMIVHEGAIGVLNDQLK